LTTSKFIDSSIKVFKSFAFYIDKETGLNPLLRPIAKTIDQQFDLFHCNTTIRPFKHLNPPFSNSHRYFNNHLLYHPL